MRCFEALRSKPAPTSPGGTFKRTAIFRGASFQRGACFSEVTFAGRARFRWATVDGEVDFSRATFEGARTLAFHLGSATQDQEPSVNLDFAVFDRPLRMEISANSLRLDQIKVSCHRTVFRGAVAHRTISGPRGWRERHGCVPSAPGVPAPR